MSSMMKSEFDIVHLAPEEWGNEKMGEASIDWFTMRPECQYVLIYEHAGWFLGFRRDGSIWASANDQAKIVGQRPREYSGVSHRRGETYAA